MASTIRPLVRRTAGVWKSRDGRWTFLRHMGDPVPQRWFAYDGDDEDPSNDGEGHTTLRDVANWAENAPPRLPEDQVRDYTDRES